MQGTRLSDLRSRLSIRCGRIRVLMLLILCVSINSRAFGQEAWFTLPIDEKAKNDRGPALQYLKAPGGAQDKFINYFQNYHLPAMTRTEPDKLGELAKLRDDLFKPLRSSTNAAAQQALTNMAFINMGKIVGAKDPAAHPAARYNAILIIGLLDQKYSDGKQPPEPLAAANKPLTAVVDSATTSDRFPPAVILGAVIGLERHAQYRQALSPEAVSAMSAALLKLVTHDAPIQEMDRDAYSWMRLRAATALARLGTVGDKNAVHDAIVKLASTSKSIDDRCTAAALLERLEYKDVKLDDAGTSEPLFALARDLAAAEDKLAQEFQEQQVGGGLGVAPGRFASQRFAEGGLSGTEVVETFPRRQALARVNDLRNGLKKVKASLPEESQKKADAVLAALNQAITACANKDTVELTLVDELRKMAEAINTAVPPAVNADADKAQEDAAFK